MAVSGLGLSLATAGGVLLYAGLKHESPLAALKEIISTGPSQVSGVSGLPVPAGSGASAGGSGPLPQLVASARTHAGDRYSQARRNVQGFSDCSSFASKAFAGIGIFEPRDRNFTTLSYMAWNHLKVIDRRSVGAGDLLITSGHMIIATGPDTGIGQQNGRRNVQEGTIGSLIDPSAVAFRYTGAPPAVQGPGIARG